MAAMPETRAEPPVHAATSPAGIRRQRADTPPPQKDSPLADGRHHDSAMSETNGSRAGGRPSDADIREAQDLLFFAYRDFTDAADVVLAELGLGRAHHRALHFIGRNPGITVSELLVILRITKQALARVLNALIDEAYVAQAPGAADRRQRLLTLTTKGAALERRLFQRQRAQLAPALAAADPAVVAGFRAVLRHIMDDNARDYLDTAHPRRLEDRALGSACASATGDTPDPPEQEGQADDR